jgi:hypothetical protein
MQGTWRWKYGHDLRWRKPIVSYPFMFTLQNRKNGRWSFPVEMYRGSGAWQTSDCDGKYGVLYLKKYEK